MLMTEQQLAQVIDVVRRVTRELTDRDLPPLSADSVLEDLGIGSLTLHEIAGTLEQELGTRVSYNALAEVQTLGELAALAHRVAPALR
jgi:acyl carrier protein